MTAIGNCLNLKSYSSDFWSNGTTVAKSLPIPIGPLGTQKKGFTLPPLQPKATLSERSGTSVPAHNKPSTAAMRRASYAERDRSRLLDPGALDFTAEDDEGDEGDDTFDQDENAAGGKSMQRAYKILQKRSEIPEAGMYLD